MSIFGVFLFHGLNQLAISTTPLFTSLSNSTVNTQPLSSKDRRQFSSREMKVIFLSVLENIIFAGIWVETAGNLAESIRHSRVFSGLDEPDFSFLLPLSSSFLKKPTFRFFFNLELEKALIGRRIIEQLSYLGVLFADGFHGWQIVGQQPTGDPSTIEISQTF